MERFFDSSECCKLLDDIEDYTKALKIGKKTPDMLEDMAKRVILMQKEINRIDREMGEPVDDELDTIENIKDYIENDTHKFTVYIELQGMDFFDYERAKELVI